MNLVLTSPSKMKQGIHFRNLLSKFGKGFLILCVYSIIMNASIAQGIQCSSASSLSAGNCSGTFSMNSTYNDPRCIAGNRAGWFIFTPTTTGIYTFTATAPAGVNPMIFITTACNGGGTCYNTTAGSVESIAVSMVSGSNYYISVERSGDGNINDFCISNVCVPSNVTITCPTNLTVECAIDVPVPNPNGVIFTSNCGGNVIHESDRVINQTCRDRFTVERTYALRIGGVIYTRCIQTITVNDQTAPSVVCPIPVTVNCAGNIPTPDVSTVLAADHCSNSGVKKAFVSDNETNRVCDHGFVINRVYSATDTCGNLRTCTQTITIDDQVNPTASCKNYTLYLGSNGEAVLDPSLLNNGSQDLCPGTLDFKTSQTFFDCNSPGTHTIWLTVSDVCGNSASCSASVTVVDTFTTDMVCRDLIIQLASGKCETTLEYLPDLTAAFCDQNPYLNTLDSNTYKIGGPLGIGTHHICYVAIGTRGRMSTCCSEIQVLEYQNPLRELACRGDIQISLDENCEATITAEYILTGGPYGCWNSYTVEVRWWNGSPLIDRNPNKPGVQIDRRDLGKDLKITIIDPRTGNSCWGKATVEDKLPPIIICPPHTTISCEMDPNPSITGTPDVHENCGTFSLTYTDQIVRGSCLHPYQYIINRTWIVIDNIGNKIQCVQTITVLNGNLETLKLPPHYDDEEEPVLLCDERIDRNKNINNHLTGYPECVDGYLLDSAYWLANPGLADIYGERRFPKVLGWNDINTPGINFGHPNPDPVYYPEHPEWNPNLTLCWGPKQHIMWAGTGRPGTSGCSNIASVYEDIVFDITNGRCEPGTSGCYKILRRWTLLDWCSGAIETYDQIIKILDKKGPEIHYPDHLEVSMDPWVCSGRWDVAAPWIVDNCSSELDYTIEVEQGTVLGNSESGFVVVEIPEGWHKAWIIALDCCGNETRHQIDLHVHDFTPPQAICQTKTVVTLIPTPDKGGSVTKVFAKSFDDRSFDNCANEVYFKVIRMGDLLGTINGSVRDNLIACNGANGDDDSGITGNQIYFDDEVKFCCEDLTNEVMVVFRVFDVDPGTGAIQPSRMNAGGDLHGRYSDCMVIVQVQDKATPVIVPPSDVVVSCNFWFDIETIDELSNNLFGTVSPDAAWRNPIKTKDRLCEAYCVPNFKTGYPGYQAGTVGKIACDLFEQYYIPQHPDSILELKWGLDGYVLSACGVTPTITVIDQRECGQGRIQRIFSVRGPNGTNVSAVQNIWVVNCDPFEINNKYCNDTTKTDIVWPNGICDNRTIELTGCGVDISPDNPALGRPRVVNRGKQHCELVNIVYKDDIYYIEEDACFKILRKWTVIDWCQYEPNWDPNFGRWERVQVIKVSDNEAPEVNCQMGPCEIAEKNPSNGICQAHMTLTATAKDHCSPEDWLKWEYKIDLYNDGRGVYGGFDYRVGSLSKSDFNAGVRAPFRDNPGADFPGNPFNASGVYPIGVHRISWFVEDGCGNLGNCSKLFEIKDCKAPTPVCHTGIVTVPMPSTGCIDVWASDLNAYSFDNCTPAERLKYYFNGDTSKRSIRICCEDFVNQRINDEMVIEVEMWVEDEAGNRDYCKTLVIIQDNLNTCPNVGTAKGKVSGLIKTTGGEEAAPVEMSLYDQGQLVRKMTGSPYAFADLEMNKNYSIQPFRDEQHSNGVSTQDIIRIQKHILGTQSIQDPYLLLSADVNKSKSITASDIAEIRKIILGIQSQFTKTNSWTFIPAHYEFENPLYPFDAPDFNNFTLDQEQMKYDFIALKMGDVTGDALARTLSKTQTRKRQIINIYWQELTSEKTDQRSIGFYSDQFTNIQGLQFTLQFNTEKLKFEGFESGKLPIDESNFGLHLLDKSKISFSWNQNKYNSSESLPLFILNFSATESALYENDLELVQQPTIAEAYDLNEQTYDIQLGSKSSNHESFELYPNVPNPFSVQTEIRFRLPESLPVKLSFYDALGKVIRIYTFDGDKGINSKLINRNELNQTSGMIYYQLDAGAYSATRRMVMLKTP